LVGKKVSKAKYPWGRGSGPLPQHLGQSAAFSHPPLCLGAKKGRFCIEMGNGPSGGFCALPYAVVPPEDQEVRQELRNFMYFLGPLKPGEPDEVYGTRFGNLAGAKEGENWSVTKEVFLKLLTKKNYEGGSPEPVFNFLDQEKVGKINAYNFLALAAAERIIGRAKQRIVRLDTPKLLESLEARARRRLWVFKLFVREKFGGSPARLWGEMGKGLDESLSLEEFASWMRKLDFQGDIEATFSLLDEDCWGKVSLGNVSGMMRAASKDGSEKGSQRGLTREGNPLEPFLSERSKGSSSSSSKEDAAAYRNAAKEGKQKKEKTTILRADRRSLSKESLASSGKENAPPPTGNKNTKDRQPGAEKEKRKASKEGSSGPLMSSSKQKRRE